MLRDQLPGVHSVHTDAAFCPEKLPAEHVRHVEAEEPAAYRPGVHGVHEEAALRDHDPGVHAVQLGAVSPEKLPEPQARHSEAPELLA